MSRWVTVGERLPEAGRLIIMYDGLTVSFGHYTGARWVGESPFFRALSLGTRVTKNVTHWQEMPDPPQTYTTDGREVYYKGTPMTPEYLAALLNRVENEIEKLERTNGR